MVAPHPRGQRKGLAAAEAVVAATAAAAVAMEAAVEETEVKGYWSGEETVISLSLSPSFLLSLFPSPRFLAHALYLYFSFPNPSSACLPRSPVLSRALSLFLPLQQTALKNCRGHVRAFGNKR